VEQFARVAVTAGIGPTLAERSAAAGSRVVTADVEREALAEAPRGALGL
jgi:hypothetical protein